MPARVPPCLGRDHGPEIVQQRRLTDQLRLFRRQAELVGDPRRHPRDPLRMSFRSACRGVDTECPPLQQLVAGRLRGPRRRRLEQLPLTLALQPQGARLKQVRDAESHLRGAHRFRQEVLRARGERPTA